MMDPPGWAGIAHRREPLIRWTMPTRSDPTTEPGLHPMRSRNQRASRRIAAAGVMATAVAMSCGLIAGCQPAAPGAAKADSHATDAKPSKVTGAQKEADLAKLELTEKAEQRLGVVAVEAKRQPVPRAISYG